MSILIHRPPEFAPDATPFGLVRGGEGLRTVRKSRLLTLCRYVEEEAENHLDPPMVLAAFQRPENYTAATARRYRALAMICPAIVLLGVAPVVDPSVHCVWLDPADPLKDEWTVVVVGAHYAVALIARDVGDTGPDGDRRYEFRLTHERRLAVAAGRILLGRLA